MKLAVLADDLDGPVVRHRVRTLVPLLLAAGMDDVRFVAIPKGVRARREAFREAGECGNVLLVRHLFTGFDFRALRGAASRLAFDFDDAIALRDPSRGRPESYLRRRRFLRAVRGADLVTAGNEYLAAMAREGGARDTLIAPTPVDTDRFSPGAPPGEGFRVGWIGSRSTRPYLRVVEAPLRALAARPGVTIAVMADAPPRELDGLPVEFTPWSETAEVPFLRSLHAGLMPLTDDAWSRGKCGFKLLQYMACGVPAVASAVGVNVEIAEGGAAARLAADDAAWIAALTELHDDRAAARDLGLRGRATAEAKWSLRALGPRHVSALCAWAR